MKISKQLEDKSRFMALVLRHKPHQANLTLDENGYVESDILCKELGITFEDLKLIVISNDKQRFSFNDDQTMIRAAQGHSIKNVDLKLEAAMPPQILYHGTKEEYVKFIQRDGLLIQNRNHVHLSDNIDTAIKVGDRRKGKTKILLIRAMEMRAAGFLFYKSDNNVWLTGNVPSQYIDFKGDEKGITF